MQKKVLLLISFALAAVLVVGQISFAAGPNDEQATGGSTNPNGISGMMGMMGNPNATKMMKAMNSPEGQNMMNACSTFLNYYSKNNQQ